MPAHDTRKITARQLAKMIRLERGRRQRAYLASLFKIRSHV